MCLLNGFLHFFVLYGRNKLLQKFIKFFYHVNASVRHTQLQGILIRFSKTVEMIKCGSCCWIKLANTPALDICKLSMKTYKKKDIPAIFFCSHLHYFLNTKFVHPLAKKTRPSLDLEAATSYKLKRQYSNMQTAQGFK